MSVLPDTSASLALLDADDLSHAEAREVWADLLSRSEDLVSTNYVLVESFALVQHRLGLEAATQPRGLREFSPHATAHPQDRLRLRS